MVKAEGNEGPLDNAENQGADIARASDESAESKDAVLYDRPYEAHGDADEHVDDGGNNRDEAGAAEEGQGVGQDDFMIAVVEPGDAQADDDAAEYALLQGQDAADVGNSSFENAVGNRAVRQDLSRQFQHGVCRSVHDEEGNHSR